MGITVLLPGGFKPPHMGHVALAKAYAKNPKVDQVRVLVGPTERDGITRDQSMLALQLLLKDPKIVVVPTEYESPMVAAFETILNLPKDDTGTYALGASSKGGDFDRINMFSKSIEQYKTKPTKDGRTAPKGIKIDDSLKVDVSPILYKGRTDGRDGDGISASTMRQDLRNGDRENFATNYPGVDSKIVNQLFDMFSKTVKEPEEKKSKKKKLKEAVRFGRLLEQRAINRLVIIQLLKEGGNVFKDEEGKPATKDINKADVIPTVKWLEKITGLDLYKSDEENNLLGTTGKKETSGDLDLAVDKNKVDQDSLVNTLLSKGIDKKDIKKTGTNVHVKTPIAGDPKNGFVQSDFMFNDNVEFMKFSMQGGAQGSKYKGVDKHLLLASIASAQGMKWSYLNGLVDRKTNEPITKDPNKIAIKLLGKGAKPEDLANVEAILNFIKNKDNYEDLVAQARQDFSKKGLELPTKEQLLAPSKKNQDNKEELKEVLKRLIEMQIIKEVDGARIQHPEDLIYWKGSEGAKAALSALQNIDPKNVSVKWDGSPAVVFGYDENGDFIFTDKNAFTAKGYDGKTKSPEDLENMLKDRGARGGKDHSKFAGNMKSVFDLAKNSVPFDKDTKEPKGFYKGDMLYFGTTNDPEEKGYVFKKEDGNYVFTPNVVTYEVPENSDLGKKIGKSKAGVVVHSFETPDGKSQDVSKVKFNPDSGLLVFPPVVSSEAPKTDKAALSKASSAVSAASSADKLLDKNTLSAMKVSDLSKILYKYTNNRVEDLNKLSAKDFDSFVKSDSEISETKKQKISAYVSENSADFDKLFNAVKAIADLKNSLISQLDSKSGDVKASIGNQPGGEGYVVKTSTGPIKLVNRGGFTAANRAVQR